MGSVPFLYRNEKICGTEKVASSRRLNVNLSRADFGRYSNKSRQHAIGGVDVPLYRKIRVFKCIERKKLKNFLGGVGEKFSSAKNTERKNLPERKCVFCGTYGTRYREVKEWRYDGIYIHIFTVPTHIYNGTYGT